MIYMSFLDNTTISCSVYFFLKGDDVGSSAIGTLNEKYQSLFILVLNEDYYFGE